MNKKDENTLLLRTLIEETLQVVLNEKKRRKKKGKKPGGGLTDLGAKRRLEPNAWHGDVSRAIAATGGDVEAAADRLDIAPRTLYNDLENYQTLQSVKDDAQQKEKE
jgi:DNA-binding NtrC family response regulator